MPGELLSRLRQAGFQKVEEISGRCAVEPITGSAAAPEGAGEGEQEGYRRHCEALSAGGSGCGVSHSTVRAPLRRSSEYLALRGKTFAHSGHGHAAVSEV